MIGENQMFKKKVKIDDFINLMVENNYDTSLDMEINSDIFDNEEVYELKRFLKLYKMSLAHFYLTGKNRSGKYIQDFKKYQIELIDQEFKTHVNKLISDNILKDSEYELFESVFRESQKAVSSTNFKPNEPFFHHILTFSKLAYPEYENKRKQDHLCDYCIQQYRALSKFLFKKIKIVI